VRPSRRRVAAFSLIVLALGGAFAYRASRVENTTAASAPSAPLALRFTPGTVLKYRAAWSGEQRGRLFVGNAPSGDTHATTSVDMALKIDLAVESVRADEATLVLTVAGIEQHRLEVLGSELFPTREAATALLTGKRARVRVGNNGVVRDVEIERGAP